MGSWKIVLSNIKRLLAIGINPAINCVLTPETDVQLLLDFFLDNEILSFKIELMRGKWLNDEHYRTLVKKYLKLINLIVNHNLNSTHKISEGRLISYLSSFVKQGNTLVCGKYPCNAGKSFFLLDEGGSFLPCGQFYGMSQFQAVNINNVKNFAEVENSFKNYRENYQKKMDSYCDGCVWTSICCRICPRTVMTTDEINCCLQKEVYYFIIEHLQEKKTVLAMLGKPCC